MISQLIPRSQSGFGIMDLVETRIAPELSPELGQYLREGKSPVWNNFKKCQSYEEAKEVGFSMVRDQIPLFQDKSNDEIEEWFLNMGKNHGFIQ